MRYYYHKSLGYWATIDSNVNEEILSKYPKGTKEIVSPPDNNHLFDGEKWYIPVPTTEELIETINATRASLLEKFVDPIVSNPFRWADMTAEEQQKIVDYRTALLDISKQETYPEKVVWPTL